MPLNKHAMEHKGFLALPEGMSNLDFSEAEGWFRHKLWPRVIPGYQRWKREIKWAPNRLAIEYRIVDLPRKGSRD